MSMNASASKRITAKDFKRMKLAGEKIAVVTAYDAAVARLVDEAGVDCILVGDSVGMVVQGHDSTLSVTLDQMIYHSSAVRRGLARAHGRAHLVVDMPFGTYQAGHDAAVENAVRLVAQGGAEAVKLEGGDEYAEVIRRISRAGIPVMGHIGLTPQSVHKLGGYVVQGKDSDKARKLLQDARELEKAGCYAVVLECIPSELAATITRQIGIATIGIGAGPHCDGQVLVIQDLLGIDTGVAPKFVKRYASLGETIGSAIEEYVDEVRKGLFPTDEHSFHSATLQVVTVEDKDDSTARHDAGDGSL